MHERTRVWSFCGKLRAFPGPWSMFCLVYTCNFDEQRCKCIRDRTLSEDKVVCVCASKSRVGAEHFNRCGQYCNGSRLGVVSRCFSSTDIKANNYEHLIESRILTVGN